MSRHRWTRRILLTLLVLTGCLGPYGPHGLTPRFPTGGSLSTHAHVMVFRSPGFLGDGVSKKVIFDGFTIANIYIREYVEFFVEPGFHGIGLPESSVALNFEQGQSYYFRIFVGPTLKPEFRRVEKHHADDWLTKYGKVE